MYLGLRGRGYARVQIELAEISESRAQLQAKLYSRESPVAAPGVEIDTGGSSAATNRAEVNYGGGALVGILQTQVSGFESRHRQRNLGDPEGVDIRLAKATLANAEQRFADAVLLLTIEDEKLIEATSQQQGSRLVPVLQVRGDSFYGLKQWQKALEQYQRVLSSQPNQIDIHDRVVSCLQALGQIEAARTAQVQLARVLSKKGQDSLVRRGYEQAVSHLGGAVDALDRLAKQGGDPTRELARAHNHRGKALLAEEKIAEALRDHEKAIEILHGLSASDGKSKLELAISYQNRGNALLAARRPDTALDEYLKAGVILRSLVPTNGENKLEIEIARNHHAQGNAHITQQQVGSALAQYERAIETVGRLLDAGQRERSNDLALAYNHRGDAFLMQGKLDPALQEYDKAIERQARRTTSEPKREWLTDLAVFHNNRGVVRRAQGNLEGAMTDLDYAIRLLGSISGQNDADAITVENVEAAVDEMRIDLAISISYGESSIDVQTRTRIVGSSGSEEHGVAFATSLKNRGYAWLARGIPASGLRDFEKAAEIYGRLVAQPAHKDLAPEFAKSLIPIAWIYASTPDAALRNASKAREYATTACELSEWKLSFPMEALAAAIAEMGNYADAVDLQTRAIELAPDQQKALARARLELYKLGKPYRMQVPIPPPAQG
jgi:tetratricopeptide (TPR) repeat protein